MKKKYLSALIPVLCTVVFLFSCAEKNDLVLRKGGSYIIGTEDDPDPNDPSGFLYKAGSALKAHLEQGTRASFHIREGNFAPDVHIFLASDQEGLAPEEIFYEIKEGVLQIRGGSPHTVMNAVYVFLEKELGFRFYAPGVTEYPMPGDLSLSEGIMYRYVPPVTTRTVHSRLFYDNPEFADALKVTHEAFPG